MASRRACRPDTTIGEAEWFTPIVADALARAVGVVGEPIETLAALEARYFPLFHALIRSAYTIGREIREDQAR